MITNKIQESCTRLSPINRLVVSEKFLQQIIFLYLGLQETEVWFTDQNSHPLEIEDKINLTLVIK